MVNISKLNTNFTTVSTRPELNRNPKQERTQRAEFENTRPMRGKLN